MQNSSNVRSYKRSHKKIKLFLIIWWNLTYNTIIGSYFMLIQILRIVSHPYNCWKRTNRCQMKMDDEFRKIYVPDRFFGERDIHVKFSWWLVMVVVESKISIHNPVSIRILSICFFFFYWMRLSMEWHRKTQEEKSFEQTTTTTTESIAMKVWMESFYYR